MTNRPVSSTRRWAPLAAVGGLAVAGGAAACWRNAEQTLLEATARCEGSTAELVYVPDGEGRVEVLVDGEIAAWEGGNERGVDFDVCERTTLQKQWLMVPTRSTSDGGTVTCRLPGRFFIHVHPTYSSQSGELWPDGSAVYLVVGEKQTLVAAAATRRDTVLTYSRRYCSED